MPEVIHTDMRQRERALAALDPVMARLIAAAGPCTWKPKHEILPFETLARAIAHQQLNGTAAQSIFMRFKALYAPATFPEPAALLATPEATLRATGLSFAKIRALRDLAEKKMPSGGRAPRIAIRLKRAKPAPTKPSKPPARGKRTGKKPLRKARRR